MVYTAHGPFVNGGAPAIDQNVMNDIDNCLTGNLGLAKVLLTVGSLARVSLFSGTGTGSAQAINHGLGATPDIVLFTYAGAFGSPPSNPAYWTALSSTQVTVVAQNTYFFWALALKLTP